MPTSIYIENDEGDTHYFADGLTGTEDVYIDPGETGTWRAVAERYGYKRQGTTFEPSLGGNVAFNPLWVEDVSLTVLDAATIAAYTDLGTAQKVNDYEAYWRTTPAGIPYDDTLLRNGETIDWTPYDVEIDPLAAVPYALVGNKVTVKTANLVANTITTTGTVSYVNGGVITGVVTDVTGVTSKSTINNLNACSVAIFDDSGDLFSYDANVSGTYDITIPSTESGEWRYVITKQAFRYQTGTFTLGTGLPNTINWIPIPDDRVVDTTEALVTTYTELDTTQKMYDYWSYWITSEEGIEWYDTVSWAGDVLDTDGADLEIDPLATELAVLEEVTNKVIIRATTISGDIRTDGVVTRVNGAKTSGVVSDSTGDTEIVTFTGFTGTNQLYVEDTSGNQRVLEAVTEDSYILYLLPSEQEAGLWKYAAKKTGFTPAVGEFAAAGGRTTIQIGMQLILQPDGTAMFTNTPVSPGIIVDWTTAPNGDPRIKLGDQAYISQDVYNATDVAMSTADGLRWLARGGLDVRIAILPAGNFIFLSAGWRFMESAVGNSNAGVNGFAISTDGQTIDDVNGPVSLLSTSSAISDADLTKLRETWDYMVNFVKPGVDEANLSLDDIKGTGFVKDVDSLVKHTGMIDDAISLSA